MRCTFYSTAIIAALIAEDQVGNALVLQQFNQPAEYLDFSQTEAEGGNNSLREALRHQDDFAQTETEVEVGRKDEDDSSATSSTDPNGGTSSSSTCSSKG